MNPLLTTAVYLTAEEAKYFISFQKHYSLINLLESIKAFDVRGGSVTLHFNSLGEIKGVDKKEYFNV